MRSRTTYHPNLFQEEWTIRRFRPREKEDEIRINHRIRVREVRLIGADGSQLGIMETRKALEMAQNLGLDLCEVSPKAKPPVCKILDYGKFKYEQKKKKSAAKKKQAVTTLKEVQFRPRTDTHDIDYKVRNILRFLEEGNKVKVSIRFRGREMAHTEIGHDLVKKILERVGDAGVMDQRAKMESRVLSFTLSPNPKAKKPKKPAAPTPPAKPEEGAQPAGSA